MKRTIKSWAEDDRPREKLLYKGRQALSDAELIAILLSSGNRRYSALELAQLLLNNANQQLEGFTRMTYDELVNIEGIGPAKAATLLAAFELGKRRMSIQHKEKLVISCAEHVFNLMHSYFIDMPHEEFHVLFLNRANHLLRKRKISEGGWTGTIADGKVIFKMALEIGAHAMILVHNHPSGQLRPSDSDRILTKKLVEFGRFIDMPILDHVILTENGYFSFTDSGIISR
jgi:DNA repair protein RadC